MFINTEAKGKGRKESTLSRTYKKQRTYQLINVGLKRKIPFHYIFVPILFPFCSVSTLFACTSDDETDNFAF